MCVCVRERERERERERAIKNIPIYLFSHLSNCLTPHAHTHMSVCMCVWRETND